MKKSVNLWKKNDLDKQITKHMKLAEALNRRADLQKKIAQIRERLGNNVKVQEVDGLAKSIREIDTELQQANWTTDLL